MLPLETRGRIAMICMWLVIFAFAASIITNFFLQDYIVEVYSTPGYVNEEITGEDILLFFVSLSRPVALLFSFITFLMWFYRARCNLDRARLTGFKYKSKWAIISFFIPLVNIYRPLKIMQEVWSGSKFLSGTTNAESWKNVQSGKLVSLWWGMTMLTIVMDRVVGYFWNQPGTPGSFLSAIYITILADVVNIVAAYIAIKLIQEVTDLQEQSRSRTPEISIPASIGV